MNVATRCESLKTNKNKCLGRNKLKIKIKEIYRKITYAYVLSR